VERDAAREIIHELWHAFYDKNHIRFPSSLDEEFSIIDQTNEFRAFVTEPGEQFVPRVGYYGQNIDLANLEKILIDTETIIDHFLVAKSIPSYAAGPEITWSEYLNIYTEDSIGADLLTLHSIFSMEVSTQRAISGQENTRYQNIDGYDELQLVKNLVANQKGKNTAATLDELVLFLFKYEKSRDSFLDAITVDNNGATIQPGLVNKTFNPLDLD